MKISLNWLKDYVSFSATPEQLAHRLTMAGLEVEKISNVDGDTVFELEITPNRPDCLNVLGIAREVSAIFNKNLKTPSIKMLKFLAKKCDISILDKHSCSRYIGVLINDVKVKPVSDILAKKLNAIGLRSINNVVDITNFCLMEFGQPLHAFDYDKLFGRKIIVRKAQVGETIVTIDGIERKLDPSILVIADEKRPVAIAGVMGGKDTEVTSETRNVLLESAYFDPIVIRRAARKLGLTSDSSYRFERGVNYNLVEAASSRAVSLILTEAGGTLAGRTDLSTAKKIDAKKSIKISIDEINGYLGSQLSASQCQGILKRLEFKVSASKNNLQVTPPSFRNDINLNVDVIEEIARVIGFDNLPLAMPQIKVSEMKTSHKFEIKKQMRNHLTSLGFDEIITYSMIDQKSLNKSQFGQAHMPIKIQNPLSMEQEMMRPMVLPSLLNVILKNANKGQKDLKFFEVGKNYLPDGEKEVLALIVCGKNNFDWRQQGSRDVDFYDIKGALESILQKFSVSDYTIKESDCSFLEEGQRAEIIIKDNLKFGKFGKVTSEILSQWDIKSKNVLVAFLDLEAIYAMPKTQKKFSAISDFPTITRDLSLAVKKEISFGQIREVALLGGGEILKSIDFKEEYLGDKIPTGQRGLVISFAFQSPGRTLREDEVNSIHNKILQSLVSNFGITQR